MPHHVLLAYPILCSAAAFVAKKQKKTRTSAEFVRTTRERLGLTQAQLAQKLELERRTVMRYEHDPGHKLPLVVRYALLFLLRSRRKKRAARL
jgi:DNA-binding XRE family transcriptional regulator